jgi:hypothetical protein
LHCGLGLGGVFAAVGERAHGAEDEADEEESNENEDECDGRGDVGLPGGEPGEEDGETVFTEAERNVGEGLRRGSDRCADCGFASVGDEGDGAAGESGDKLLGGSEAGGGLKSEQRGDGDADESVQRVPDEVECRDFVDEEIDAEENESGGDDAPVGQQVQRWGQFEKSCVGHEAEGGDGGVDVEPGRETDGDHQGDKLVGREGHRDSIDAGD